MNGLTLLGIGILVLAVYLAHLLDVWERRRDARYRDGFYLERDETDRLPRMGKALRGDDK